MAEIFHRVRAMRDAEKPAADGKIRILASTDDAVSWGDWSEVLSHKDGAVDSSAARSLLINHKADQLAGGISSMVCDGRQMESDGEIDEDAMMQSGVSVRRAVEKGYLRGVSIGYSYERSDTVFDEQTRTLTVNRWRLLEISLTPIPADAKAQVRSLPFAADKAPEPITPAAIPAAVTKEVRVSDPDQKPIPQGEKAADTVNLAKRDEGVRAAAIQEAREISELARDHSLDASKYIGQSKTEASSAMLRDLAERNKTKTPTITPAEVNVDQADKARDAFLGAISHNAGVRGGAFKDVQEGNNLRGNGVQHAIRKYAALMGIDSSDWSKRDIAAFALGKPEMMDARFGRAANVVSSNFPSFVFLNAVSKIVANGYEMGAASARYKRVVSDNTAPDFRSYYIGALAGGNLTQTAENVAFPELSKAEGAYNNTAKMWGATLSLTIQAIANDDTAQFDRLLRMAGAIADKTIDRRVFQKLLMGTSAVEATSTWTSNTTSGGSLVYTTADLAVAARGRLALVRAALMNKVGLDGNPLGTIPRYLICGPTREVEAQGIVGTAPGQIGPNTQPSISTMEVIATPWLEASALTGYSATSYYLLGDPNEVTGLVLTKVRGYENIQVQPYDPGAVAALNWKLWLPFEADLHYLTVGSTATVAAAQQGTT